MKKATSGGAGGRKPNRIRKSTNLTLSEVAREMGGALAESRGVPFARFVEQLIREELRKAGKLPPE